MAPARLASGVFIVCVALTIATGEQSTDVQTGVDAINNEDGAARVQPAPEIALVDRVGHSASRETAMTAKVMELLKTMMKKRQTRRVAPHRRGHRFAIDTPLQRKQQIKKMARHPSHKTAKKMTHAQSSKHQRKMSKKVMQLLTRMTKKKQVKAARTPRAHRSTHVTRGQKLHEAHAAHKEAKKRPHVHRVKNGFAILSGLVHASEDAATRREEKEKARVEAVASKKKEEERAKLKHKVEKQRDVVMEALQSAAGFDESRASKERARKQSMSSALKAAQAQKREDEDEWDLYDDVPAGLIHDQVVDLKAIESNPVALSEKGKSLLAHLIHVPHKKKVVHKKVSNKKRSTPKVKKSTHGKAEISLDQPLHSGKVARHPKPAAAKHPLRKHPVAAPKKRKTKKQKINLVDAAIMSALASDLHDVKAVHKHKKPKKAHAKRHHANVQDRLSEEEAFGREVERNMHKESKAKSQRRHDEEEGFAAAQAEERREKRAEMLQDENDLHEIVKGHAKKHHTDPEAADKAAGRLVRNSRNKLRQDLGLTRKGRHSQVEAIKHDIAAASKGGDDDETAAAIAAKLFKRLGAGKMKIHSKDLAKVVRAGLVEHTRQKSPPKSAKHEAKKAARKELVAPVAEHNLAAPAQKVVPSEKPQPSVEMKQDAHAIDVDLKLSQFIQLQTSAVAEEEKWV